MQVKLKSINNIEPKITIIVMLWALGAFQLGYRNAFSNMPLPLFGITVILIVSTLIVSYLKYSPFQIWCDSIPLKLIALFHSWRILAGWVFLVYSGVLPDTFINNAAYGDIVAGVLGLSVFIVGFTKRNYLIFNIVGMLDFILAVGTGLTLTILGEDKMASIAQLPLIMIPLFGVPLSGFTHFISLRRLFKMRNQKLTDIVE